MSPVWDDLNARVRGLGSHLLTRPQLGTLAGAPDLEALAIALRAAGIDPGDDPAPAAEALELAVRRTAAAQLRILARWAGPRSTVLAVVFEDFDRRSLRAILRGAAQGAGAEQRLAGLLPTPSLPERALAELARQPTVTAFASLLTAWRHPYGSPLMAEAASPHPDLFKLELTLNRTFAARALRAARRAGRSGPLIDHVRLILDLENAATALVLTGAGRQVTPRDAFLPAGVRVTIDVYEEAIATGSVAAAGARLGAAFAGTPLAAAFRDQAHDPAALEPAIAQAEIAMLTGQRRRQPLEATTVVLFAVQLRAQACDLRRIIWGAALGAPAGARLASAGAS